MAIQLIRLSQIKANLPEFVDFEQQLVSMFGENNTEKFTAAREQQIFSLQKAYAVGKGALKVFVNGILQVEGSTDGYIELNSKMIKFTEPLFEGDLVIIIRNTFQSFAATIGKERVKAYNIYRQSYFITGGNANQTVFPSPFRYTPNYNQLKVYANGLLLTAGLAFDYVETSDNEFKLNRNFPIGTIITAEVISGGLNVYRCDRYPLFIDQAKASQRLFVLPQKYVPESNNLKVYLNGQLLRKGSANDYDEESDTMIRFHFDLPVGAVIEFEVTTFTVDVFTITRQERLITELNKNQLTFTTKANYTMGETNLRVYLNGILLREGSSEDYEELTTNTFKFTHDELPIDAVVEYEIINW